MAFSIPVLCVMPEIAKKYEAVIVGAGLAGAAAAIHLSRAGKSVCLIEKSSAAHNKVCGEFLSHEAVSYLDELGLDIKTLGAVPINKMRLVKGRHCVQAPLPFQAYSLSRYVLDETLIDLAKKSGVKVKRGVTITNMSKSKIWQVKGDNFTAHGNALFLATGKHDVKAWQRPDGVKNDYIGFKMHYDLNSAAYDVISGHSDVIMFSGGYAGVQPIENGRANLCLVIEKNRFKALGLDWDALLKVLMQDSPHTNFILRDAKPCWDKPLAIYGIPYGFLNKPRQGLAADLYRLGDQMAVIPSFAGGGMAIALYTAKLAVENYLDKIDYTEIAFVNLKSHIQKSTWLGRIMASRVGQYFLMTTARICPNLLTLTAHYTRLNHKNNYFKH